MSLTNMPNELLYMVADHLDIINHSALTLVSRHIATVLQHRLRARMRKLALQDDRYTILAMHWCVASRDYEQLKFLLENTTTTTILGPFANSLPPYFTTPGVCDGFELSWIRASGLALRILARGQRSTAAQYAIQTNHCRLLRLVCNHERTHQSAFKILCYAACFGQLQVFKIALEAFRANLGKVELEQAHRKSLKMVASCRDVRFYFQDGESFTSRDAAGKTLLHRAVIGLMRLEGELPGSVSHSEVVRLFLREGADVDARDNAGMTPLHIAAAALFKDIVKLLLLGGATVDALDNEGCSPVHLALRAEWGPEKSAVVALLQEYGADFSIADAKGVVARDLIDEPMKLRSSRRRAA